MKIRKKNKRKEKPSEFIQDVCVIFAKIIKNKFQKKKK